MTSTHSQVSGFSERALNSQLLFFACIILGLGTRLLLALQTPFWLDELWSSAFSHPDQMLAEVIKNTIDDVHPPLYQILLYGWFQLFGFTELSGRFSSLLVGISAIPLFYLLAEATYDAKIARLATMLFTISPLAVGFSSEVRSYELLLLLSILSSYCLVKALKNNQPIAYIGYYLSSLAIAYTHYFGIILLFCHFVSLVIISSKTKNWKTLGIILGIYCLLLLSYLPMLQAVFSNIVREQFWIKNPSFLELLMFIPWYFSGPFALPLFVFLGWLACKQAKTFSLREALITLSIVIILFLPWALGFIISPVTTLRNCIVFLPLIVLLISYIAASSQARHSLIIMVYASFILLIAVGYTVINKGEHLDRLLVEVRKSSAPLYFPETENPWTMEYFNTKIQLNIDKYPDIHPQRLNNKSDSVPSEYWLACYHKCGDIDLNNWIPITHKIKQEVTGRGIEALLLVNASDTGQ